MLLSPRNTTRSYSDTLVQDAFVIAIGTQRQSKAVTSTLFGNAKGTYDAEVMGLGMYRQTTPVSTTLYYERDPSGRLLALTDGTTVYYYGLDGHGSVTTVTDSAGALKNFYTYDPYGNKLYKVETAGLANPWQYAGGYRDAESGIYLLGVRYYSPALGRFLQQDPAGSGGKNPYAYAGSNPCNNSDPTGATTCYHYVSGDQVTKIVNDLTNQEGGATITAAILGAVSVVTALTGVGAPVAIATGVGAGVAGAIGGTDILEINALEGGPRAPYLVTGFYLRYNFTDVLGDDLPCMLNDTSVQPLGHPIVSGWPFEPLILNL